KRLWDRRTPSRRSSERAELRFPNLHMKPVGFWICKLIQRLTGFMFWFALGELGSFFIAAGTTTGTMNFCGKKWKEQRGFYPPCRNSLDFIYACVDHPPSARMRDLHWKLLLVRISVAA